MRNKIHTSCIEVKRELKYAAVTAMDIFRHARRSCNLVPLAYTRRLVALPSRATKPC